MKKKIETKEIVIIALLVALYVVLARFVSLRLASQVYGFSFVAIAVGAILYGPLAGLIVGALGDFIGALLFPRGQYFIGFTITAALTGLIFGIFLYKKEKKFFVIIAVVLNAIICTILVNSLWLSLLYGKAYKVYVVGRLIQAGFNIIIQVPIIIGLKEALKRTRLIEEA